MHTLSLKVKLNYNVEGCTCAKKGSRLLSQEADEVWMREYGGFLACWLRLFVGGGYKSAHL